MRILVTGGAGFIGTNLIKNLLKLDYEVYSIDNYSTIRLTLQSGSIDFGTDSINEYWYKDHFADNPEALNFLSEVIPALNVGNFDNSDPMTDYFHVGWYVDVNLGRYDKPYVYTGGK